VNESLGPPCVPSPEVRGLISARALAARHGELSLAVRPGQVGRILDLVGLDGQLPGYPSIREGAADHTANRPPLST
jgi:hypothetical protein